MGDLAPIARHHRRRLPRRAVGLLLGTVLALGAGSVVVGSPPVAAAEPTGACRSVEDGSVRPDGGPHRATVVVDTGSGPVWSACISFSGTVSGVGALDLAARSIPDLAPVYDQYVGQGRAVCQLRGVGNDPPDCLGKSEDYWAYYVNGRYSRLGAGAVTVGDGDVQGWRWGTGDAGPRRATRGHEAVAWTPPTTPPPTTAPPATAAPTVAPAPSGAPPASPGPGSGSGGGGEVPSVGDATAPPATVAGQPTTTTVAGSTTAPPGGSPSSTSPARVESAGSAGSAGSGSGDSGDSGGSGGSGDSGGSGGSGDSGEQAAVLSSDVGGSGSGASGGTGWLSAVGFAVVVAAITAVGLVRRRSRPPAPA